MESSSALTDSAVAAPGTCRVLDVEYYIGDLDAASALVLDRAKSGAGGYACLCGVHGIVTAQHNTGMMDALSAVMAELPGRGSGGVAHAPIRRRRCAARGRP